MEVIHKGFLATWRFTASLQWLSSQGQCTAVTSNEQIISPTHMGSVDKYDKNKC